jgi:hypothetical protein
LLQVKLGGGVLLFSFRLKWAAAFPFASALRRKQSGACMQPYMVRWQALVDLINGRNSAGFSMRFLFFFAVDAFGGKGGGPEGRAEVEVEFDN